MDKEGETTDGRDEAKGPNSISFKAFERRNTTAQVVDALQAMILDRQLSPGDALPSERELATLLSVSRNVLREALGILRQRGLVDSRHGTGTYVSLPSSSQARDALILLLEMSKVSLVELCDARILIEPELAYFAALRDDEEGRTWRSVTSTESGCEFH